MKIKEISQLDSEELAFFHSSRIYEMSHADYKLCGIHRSYYQEYFGDKWKDLSLLAYDKDDCYIVMYMYTDGNELSFFGSPIQIFSIDDASQKTLARAYQELFAKLESFKAEYGAQIIKFSNNMRFISNYYEHDGFKDHVTYHSYIDLTQSDDIIFMNVRKSYKSLINWGKRSMEMRVYDEHNITKEIMEQFEEFHIQTSGRRTRSHKSWELQYEAVAAGQGFIVLGYLNAEMVTAILILSGHTECFYGVCVNRRDLMETHQPIGHPTLFKCIMVAKEKGYKKFNIGDVTMRVDPKGNEIVKYQRGFNCILESKVSFEANI